MQHPPTTGLQWQDTRHHPELRAQLVTSLPSTGTRCPSVCHEASMPDYPVCCYHPTCRAKAGVAAYCVKLSPWIFG